MNLHFGLQAGQTLPMPGPEITCFALVSFEVVVAVESLLVAVAVAFALSAAKPYWTTSHVASKGQLQRHY